MARCWKCNSEGEQYPGPPRAAASYFLASAIWALHKARQALDALGRRDRANLTSALTREVEALTEDTDTGSNNN